jgi:hypothetical protein
MYIDIMMPESKDVNDVFVDGVLVNMCTSLNTEEGWVETFVRDENDNLVLSEDKMEVLRTRVYGRVEVTWKDGGD